MLFRQHVESVRRYCARRLGSSEVDDAVADVFTVAWRRLDRVPAGDEALPYLYGIARNTVRNHRRSAQRRSGLFSRARAVGSRVASDGPEVQVVVRQEAQEVLQALSRLRPRDQELLRLRAWEELDRHEIASVLGISAAAVDMRLNRATKRLAAEVDAASAPLRQAPSWVEEEAS